MRSHHEHTVKRSHRCRLLVDEELPIKDQRIKASPVFVAKLLDLGFWEGKWRVTGPKSLIPPEVAKEYSKVKSDRMLYDSLPGRIRKVFEGARGISYAKKKYGDCANDDYTMRTAVAAGRGEPKALRSCVATRLTEDEFVGRINQAYKDGLLSLDEAKI